MTDSPIYSETVSSKKTGTLFIGLTLLFFMLHVRRMLRGGRGILTALFFGLGAFFFFYALNYRTLVILLTPEHLKLKFGLFTWNIPLDNIKDGRLDDLPLLMEMGGAGIHFMSIRKRYRASFNFLEHPRVVVALKQKWGPVQDISFSTRRPEELLQLLQVKIAAKGSRRKSKKGRRLEY